MTTTRWCGKESQGEWKKTMMSSEDDAQDAGSEKVKASLKKTKMKGKKMVQSKIHSFKYYSHSRYRVRGSITGTG
jgi:hypothetical protein